MSSSSTDDNEESSVYDVGQDVDLTKTDDEDDEYASAEVEVNKLDENKKCERYESDTEEGEQVMIVDDEPVDNGAPGDKSDEIPQEKNQKSPPPGIFSFSAGDEIEKANVDKDMLNIQSILDEEEEEEEEDPPPRRSLRSKDSKEMKAKDILASLPCVERLKPTGSSGEKSETGENGSDLESVTSTAAAARQLRNKNKKLKKTSKGNSKKSALTTRSSKGKGRRSALKKKPVKTLPEEQKPLTSNRIYYKGEYFLVGDIVSLTDISGDIYYGQLRGFLTDQFGEKSAVMSWLLPTTGSPPPNEGFHPATYIIGPEEEIPRKMEVFTFVMHAPSDYFLDKTAPYRTESAPTCKDGFTTLRLGPRVRKTADNKTIYVGVYS